MNLESISSSQKTLDERFRRLRDISCDMYILASGDESTLPTQNGHVTDYSMHSFGINPGIEPNVVRVASFNDSIYVDLIREHNDSMNYYALEIFNFGERATLKRRPTNPIGSKIDRQLYSNALITSDEEAIATFVHAYHLIQLEAEANWPNRFSDDSLYSSRQLKKAFGSVATMGSSIALPKSCYL